MAKKSSKKHISVFIAAPEDLAAERKQFRAAVNQLNAGFADGANVIFEALGGEDTPVSTDQRNRRAINKEIDRCDVFILVLHQRWGLEVPDAAPYSSYTEEEFQRALERRRKKGSPEIFVFFKRVAAAQEANAGPQLKKIMELRRQLEETGQVMYRYIDDSEQSFIKEIGLHLRAYAQGELGGIDKTHDMIVLPLPALKEIKKAQKETTIKIRSAKDSKIKAAAAKFETELLQLQAAEKAATLTKKGKLEQARQLLVEVSSDTENISILNLAYEFFSRTGDSGSALDVLERWLLASGPDKQSADTAAACGNLGRLNQARGEFDRACEMYQKSLTINEALGNKEGMAANYGNLGILFQTQGNLDLAEKFYQKSLAINEALGRKEGMASAYGNLGILYQTRGDLKLAEKMYQKSLVIEEALGRKESMAGDYGNLGILYQTRGDLDRAEEMYQKSLTINEALGHKDSMAGDCGKLGILYQTSGDLNRAEKMYRKSLELFEAINSPNSAVVGQWLANLQNEILKANGGKKA